MHDNQLLATLAKLCGDITLANNINADEILRLQQILATAVTSDPTVTGSSFRFAETGTFSSEQLPTTELQQLSTVLKKIEDAPQSTDKNIRVISDSVESLMKK